jgi:hypothetical protein
MIRSLVPTLVLAMAVCSATGALADDAKEKASAVAADTAAQPKIRVILPASWEPAIRQDSSEDPSQDSRQGSSQTASSQRSVAR